MKDQPFREFRVTEFSTDSADPLQKTDRLASETAIALVFNGISHAVMMASPENLIEFATGFSFTEGIINHPDEILDTELVEGESGIEVHLTLTNQQFSMLKQRRRNLVGRTGCGICGAESLQQVQLPLHPVTSNFTTSHAAILKATSQLAEKQPLQNLTGAVHGAAWCDGNGNIKLLREDVGRHNALDKLIGCMLIENSLREPGFLLISSRASYEMLQKAAIADISVVVAVSAATTMAVEIADQSGICLVGFSRDSRHLVYSHGEKIAGDQG